MDSADVIIIGGGIVGSSIAYHLTEAGCRNVLVIERETQQGKGSTGKSMGGVRAQFATPINIRMSLYSIAFFAAFDEVMGHPAGYRPQGYLFVATTPAHMDYLRQNYRHQVEAGLESRCACWTRRTSRTSRRNCGRTTSWAAVSARPTVSWTRTAS